MDPVSYIVGYSKYFLFHTNQCVAFLYYYYYYYNHEALNSAGSPEEKQSEQGMPFVLA